MIRRNFCSMLFVALSISVSAAASDETVRATEVSAAFTGRNAKPIPCWNSTTAGADENAIRRRLATRSAM